MTESHTYVNTGPATAKTADTVDLDFLTDANVYYNLPPPLPVGYCRGASLPRGRFAAQHQLARGSSSCPASPKLSTTAAAAALLQIDVNSCEKGAGEVLVRPSKPSPAVLARGNDATQESTGKDPQSPPLKARGTPKPRSKKLSHTRSFDLDHIYQNLVKVASKPRSNSFSIDLPWRRRKKVVDATPPDIREDSGEDGHIGIGQNQTIPSKPEPPREPSPQSRADLSCQARCNSSSSSSSSSSESDCVADDCSADVRPGVTYLRKHGQRTKVERNSSTGEAVNILYHSTATLPLHAGRVSSPVDSSLAVVEQRPVLDVNANLDEWLRKERWLEKKRCSRNFRPTNESGEVDISILHASDGDKWKNYLYEVFTQLVPGEDRTRVIRVEANNVEEIEEDLGRLQAVKLKGAKLQIVIMSPCFLDHIAGHGKSELGQVFRPEKVLALLLGVDDSQLHMAHLSALYSYSDWHKLKVRDMDPSFVYEVLTEGVKILNNCELYSKYQDERNARFKVTPRKVTEMQQLVHLMLNDPVDSKRDIEILIECPSKPSVNVEKFRLRNPYTIEFRMPDEFMVGSSLLLVTVLVKKMSLGSRQLKCESSLDSMRALLTTVSNPTIFMCQALNINPTSDVLDQKLTETVRTHVPLSKLKEQRTDKCCSEFPTWVHFSAYYGLEQLTWALLEIPGGEAALNRPNQHGHTPSVLAYQKGFHLLAHTLEDAALMVSLAAKLNYEPVSYNNINKVHSINTAAEIYSSPPPPRPLNSPLYDHPPSPQEVPRGTVESSSVEVSKQSNIASQPLHTSDDTNPTVSELPPPPSPYHGQHHPPSTLSAASAHGGKQDGRYLEMRATQDNRDSDCYEYSEDVYTLVTAWLEKTDMKAFVEKHQEKIGEVKSKLDLNTTREEYHYTKTELGATAGTASEADDKNVVPDLQKQENMVEQFFTLIKGARPPCELPSDCVDVPTQQATDEVSSSPKDEPSTCTASTSSEICEEKPQPAASSSGPAGLVTAQMEASKHALNRNGVSSLGSRSNSVDRITHAPDEKGEMLYAVVN